MRDQLDRLLEYAARDRVTLQIAEFADGPHPGTYAPFSLFRFAEPELPDMVFTEYLTGALYLDSRKEVSAHLEVLDHMTARGGLRAAHGGAPAGVPRALLSRSPAP